MGASTPELLFYNYQLPMADVSSVGVLRIALCTGQASPPAGNPFLRLPTFYSSSSQQIIDKCLS